VTGRSGEKHAIPGPIPGPIYTRDEAAVHCGLVSEKWTEQFLPRPRSLRDDQPDEQTSGPTEAPGVTVFRAGPQPLRAPYNRSRTVNEIRLSSQVYARHAPIGGVPGGARRFQCPPQAGRPLR